MVLDHTFDSHGLWHKCTRNCVKRNFWDIIFLVQWQVGCVIRWFFFLKAPFDKEELLASMLGRELLITIEA